MSAAEDRCALDAAQARMDEAIRRVELALEELGAKTAVDVDWPQTPGGAWSGMLFWRFEGDRWRIVYSQRNGHDVQLRDAHPSVRAEAATSGTMQRLVHAVQEQVEAKAQQYIEAATRYESLVTYLLDSKREGDGGAR